jgi:hypothetical protein
VIVGSDLVYDPGPALPRALASLLRPGSVAYLASTPRNPDTLAAFLGHLEAHGLVCVQFPLDAAPQCFDYDCQQILLHRVTRRTDAD